MEPQAKEEEAYDSAPRLLRCVFHGMAIVRSCQLVRIAAGDSLNVPIGEGVQKPDTSNGGGMPSFGGDDMGEWYNPT